jgi:hypothetical protein
MFSSRYRRQVKHVLVKQFWRKWKSWWGFHENQIRPEILPSSQLNVELELA